MKNKNIFLLLSLSLFLVSCGLNTSETVEQDNIPSSDTLLELESTNLGGGNENISEEKGAR